MQGDTDEEQPALFDDPRKALDFALNQSRVEMPRPFMNKAMAEASEKLRLKEARKLAKKRAKRRAMTIPGTESAEDLLVMETTPKPRRSRPAGPPPLTGLDKPHAAGFILQHFAELDPVHQLVLKGIVIHAYDPCECRSGCCSGWRRNARWAEAVKAMCVHMKEAGDILKEPGKRGLSTQPEMRLLFVEQFYTKNAMTVAEAARRAKVSTITATKHRDWIFEYLEQIETEAWMRVAALFDEVGITGAFT